MAKSKEETAFHFDGFDSPNGTIVPDVFFDVLAPNCGEAELRCLIYIIRRTFGFKKNSDAISLSQMVDGITTRDGRVLDMGTGMSRKGVVRGCAGLVEKGIVVKDSRLSEQGDNDINIYRLRFKNPAVSGEAGVGNEGNYGGDLRSLRVGNVGNPQQTGLQETDRHYTENNSKERNSNVFHSNRTHAQLSTSLRAQRIVDNERAGDEAAADPELPPAQERPSSTGHIRNGRRPQDAAPGSSGSTAGRGRPPKAPDQLMAALEEASQKLSDEQPRSSMTRATKLWRESGLPVDKFCQRAYQAMAETRQAKAKKTSAYGAGVMNRMPLFFAELERQLGFRDKTDWSVRLVPPGL